MNCEFLCGYSQNFSVTLYWPVSIILDHFWSFGHCRISHNGSLWNWAHKVSRKICHLITAVFANGDTLWLIPKRFAKRGSVRAEVQTFSSSVNPRKVKFQMPH